MADALFPKTHKYRTIHSMSDYRVGALMDLVGEGVPLFVDYGCHLGHVSFEVALRERTELVLSVDNFRGTEGDELMAGTVRDLAGDGGDFLFRFLENLNEMRPQLFGLIIPMRAEFFWEIAAPALRGEVDIACIDSSHRPEDDWEFAKLSELVRPGGVFCGDDYTNGHSPNVADRVDEVAADPQYSWIHQDSFFALRKASA